MPDPLHPHAVKSAGAKQFVYDAVGNQIDRPNETITYTDWDLPRQYIPKGGEVPTTFDVHNNERVVAIVERAASGESWSFVHADHLGSVDVISNEAVEEIDRRSFDAWGAPRDRVTTALSCFRQIHRASCRSRRSSTQSPTAP